jgi:hypothetical protein
VVFGPRSSDSPVSHSIRTHIPFIFFRRNTALAIQCVFIQSTSPHFLTQPFNPNSNFAALSTLTPKLGLNAVKTSTRIIYLAVSAQFHLLPIQTFHIFTNQLLLKNTSEKTPLRLYQCKLFKFKTTTAVIALKIQAFGVVILCCWVVTV